MLARVSSVVYCMRYTYNIPLIKCCNLHIIISSTLTHQEYGNETITYHINRHGYFSRNFYFQIAHTFYKNETRTRTHYGRNTGTSVCDRYTRIYYMTMTAHGAFTCMMCVSHAICMRNLQIAHVFALSSLSKSCISNFDTYTYT